MIEYNEEYNKKLKEIVKKNPVRYGTVIRGKKFRYLYDYVMECTKETMESDVRLSIRVIWVLNEWQEYPKCKGCGKPLDKIGPGWKLHFGKDDVPLWITYHSSHCWHLDPEAIERMNNTLQERYGEGIINVFQVESIKEKCGDTKEERYGDRKYKNWEKNRKTCMERYGAENIRKSEYGKQKIRETNLKKYGVEYVSQSSEFRSKMHKTYDYQGHNFDTSWELAFYIWHKDHGIELKHEPEKLLYKDRNGDEHYYFPDFKIEDKFYEIKGGQFFDRDGKPLDRYKDKFDFMESIGVVLLKHEQMKPYLEYVKEKYGKDFLKSCKRK